MAEVTDLALEPTTKENRWAKFSEAQRLRDRASKLRAQVRDFDQARSRERLKGKLPPHQELVFRAMLEGNYGFAATELRRGFGTFEGMTGLDRKQLRRACKALCRVGLAEFCRGLFNDDGEVAGSGYGLTKIGAAWAAEHHFKALDQ